MARQRPTPPVAPERPVRARPLRSQIEARVSKPEVEKTEPVEFLDTGCIPLNLAASQMGTRGGWARGRVINLVGDGSSGKTLLSLEAAANAFYNIRKVQSNIFPPIKKLTIVYNNSEGVMDFPIAEMYGQEFVDFVEWTNLTTCESFGRDILRRLKNHKPGDCLLYFQDSVDSTISEAAVARIDKSIKEDKAEDGSYGTEKAKYFSQSFFNRLCGEQQGKDATIFLVSQVRENLNAGMFGKKFYRTGGKAMDFYTHQVAWLYKKESHDKTFRGQKRVYGVTTLAKFDRNKVALPFREAELMIRFDYGVDNLQSMINFMYGPKNKKIEFNGEEMDCNELRLLLDDSPEDCKLMVAMVEKEWAEIENAVKTKFRPKYE